MALQSEEKLWLRLLPVIDAPLLAHLLPFRVRYPLRLESRIWLPIVTHYSVGLATASYDAKSQGDWHVARAGI